MSVNHALLLNHVLFRKVKLTLRINVILSKSLLKGDKTDDGLGKTKRQDGTDGSVHAKSPGIEKIASSTPLTLT